jgi:hypothetical protein
MFRYSNANHKTEKLYKYAETVLARWLSDRRYKVYSVDLLSGYSCPFAEKCLSRAVEVDDKRKIKDGPKTEFRCFSASQEARLSNVYNKRKANFEALKNAKTEDGIYKVLSENLPLNAGVVRMHVSGDFFSPAYFKAFLRLARDNPNVLFYAYTKALRYWLDNRDEVESLDNVVMTASRGGKDDHLIDEHALREARVVLAADEVEYIGELDETDIHAADPARRNESFRLLIHGSQPAGTDAAKALQILKTA